MRCAALFTLAVLALTVTGCANPAAAKWATYGIGAALDCGPKLIDRLGPGFTLGDALSVVSCAHDSLAPALETSALSRRRDAQRDALAALDRAYGDLQAADTLGHRDAFRAAAELCDAEIAR